MWTQFQLLQDPKDLTIHAFGEGQSTNDQEEIVTESIDKSLWTVIEDVFVGNTI